MIPILPSTYCGNIAYFWYLAKNAEVYIDIDETYKKQTYRNRCEVLGANGSLNLSVPVERPQGRHTKTKNVIISNAEGWRQVHWKTLVSCYNRTPYFEFYADQIQSILFKDFNLITDLNHALSLHLIDKIGLTTKILSHKPTKCIDVKEAFNPKISSKFSAYPYLQTFTDRFGFTNNLSILDLLFNEGPNTICILNESKHEIK